MFEWIKMRLTSTYPAIQDSKILFILFFTFHVLIRHICRSWAICDASVHGANTQWMARSQSTDERLKKLGLMGKSVWFCRPIDGFSDASNRHVNCQKSTTNNLFPLAAISQQRDRQMLLVTHDSTQQTAAGSARTRHCSSSDCIRWNCRWCSSVFAAFCNYTTGTWNLHRVLELRGPCLTSVIKTLCDKKKPTAVFSEF